MGNECCENLPPGQEQSDSKKLAPLRGRTFSGCWACRLHKKRCDERRPRCSYCIENNLKCCYDVRLIWLDENSYVISPLESSQLARKSQLKRQKGSLGYKGGQKLKRCKLPRESLVKATLSPPNSDSEIEDEINLEEVNAIKEPAALNIRRLKLYDNQVESVYGKGKTRNYDQKHVNNILNGLLKDLDTEIKQMSCCTGIRHGPFSMFNGHYDSGIANIPSPNNHHHNSKIDAEKLDRMKMFIDDLVENKIYTILWLNTHGNMILSRAEYRTWFLGYMKRTLPFEFCKTLEQIINDANPFNIFSWLKIIKNKWFNNPDWQTISFTILVVVHGYTCPELSSELESWFLTQSVLQYSMYPLINFVVRNSTNLPVLYHCNELLNGSNETSQDLYQGELVNEMNVLVAKKLVNIWRDKILLQLCSCEDTTNSCSQLKYWELQLKYNETFYTDVYSS